MVAMTFPFQKAHAATPRAVGADRALHHASSRWGSRESL
jgi:hypothetical protein